ncbi:S-adenosyl-L-methionine-dependent methyltransferase [Lactarius akahatsu]|uniref:S-adenosyl-L-methionine-dependent methyltransferase n=1 Tax=Lactarius akahatsu TaxID=416441 RepID=A0AAD4QDP9_9AGAM|nr:S-adenosyl-L-methionine-dependent methyltransferase [Lactarius akahatsu]
MSSESKIPIEPKYVLDDNNSEVSRLNTQYLFFKTSFDYIVPPVVNVAHLSRVIDVAAGTGAWALDFVSRPDVRDRDVQVFACDISTAKFPQADKPDVNKITFFQHDVTKPFPDEMLGTFDLVNMNYLGFGLTVQGWPLALQNLRDLLKPGGHLILRDGDPFLFTHENPPPLEGQEHDIVTYTQGKSALATINRLYSGWALQQGFVLGLSYHMQKMLQDASLPVLSSLRVLVPHGNYCMSHKGLHGSPLSEYTAFSLQSFSQVINVLSLALMEAGCLELGDGTLIADEEERLALVKELQDFAEGGILFLLSEWVVVRPLGS